VASLWIEEWIGPYQQHTNSLRAETREGGIDLLVRSAIQDNELLSKAARRLLHVFDLPLPLRTVVVDKQPNHLDAGNEVPQ
jgi:hypothetical protein